MAGSVVQEARVTNNGDALTNFQVSLPNPVLDETGLLACWHFDESSGQEALDSSEYKLHLTFTGTTTASGIQTNARVFSGAAGQYAEITSAEAQQLDMVYACTMAAWVYPIGRATGDRDGLYRKRTYLTLDPTGRVAVYYYGLASEGYHVSTGTVPLNAWSHIASTYDSHTGQVLIYINGVLDKTVNTSGIISTVATNMTVGGDSGRPYNGRLDELRIYNRALTATEIAFLANPSSPYRFDYKDVKFFSDVGCTSELGWWREHDGLWWVKIPTVLASPNVTKFYCSYGDLSASDSSNGTNTFDLFDDFDGPTLSSSWNSSTANGGTVTFANGAVRIAVVNGAASISRAVSDVPNNTYLETHITPRNNGANWRFRPTAQGLAIDTGLFSGTGAQVYWNGFITSNGVAQTWPYRWGGVLQQQFISSNKTVRFGPFYINDAALSISYPTGHTMSVGDGASFGGDVQIAWWRVRKRSTNVVKATYAGKVGQWRRQVTITNSGSTLTNQQVLIEDPTVLSAQAFYSDLFLVSGLSFWQERPGRFWVKVPTLTNGSNILYAVNGSENDVVGIGSGDNTFEAFDDFSGKSIDTNKWTLTDPGSNLRVDDKLSIKGGTVAWTSCINNNTALVRTSQGYSFYTDWVGFRESYQMFGVTGNAGGTSYTDLVYGNYPRGDNATTVYENGSATFDTTPGVNNRFRQTARIDILSGSGAIFKRSTNQGRNFNTIYTSALSSTSPLKMSMPWYNRSYEVYSMFVTKYTTNTLTATFGAESDISDAHLGMSLNIDHLDKSTSISMRFAVPVGAGVKPGVLTWPRSSEQEALGIATIPFTKRGDRN